MYSFMALSRYLGIKEYRWGKRKIRFWDKIFRELNSAHRDLWHDLTKSWLFSFLFPSQFAYFLACCQDMISEGCVLTGPEPAQPGSHFRKTQGQSPWTAQGRAQTSRRSETPLLSSEVVRKGLLFLAFLLPLCSFGPWSDLSVSWLWSHMPFSTLESELYKAPALWQ